MDLNNILLNPVRARIIQYLAFHKAVTAGELVSFMTDIPRTTLYRHINTLVKSNILSIVSENRIRGTLEKVYSLNISAISSENTLENAPRNAFGFLMNIYSDFERYFNTENPNPGRDKLFLNNIVLMLSDEEYDGFLMELQTLLRKHLNNEPSSERKPRNLSIISAPSTEQP